MTRWAISDIFYAMTPIESARLQDHFLKAFTFVSPEEASELSAALAGLAREKGFTYERGGEIETVNLMLLPGFISREQASYLNSVALAVKRGMEAVFAAWFNDVELQKLLPFDEDEGAWIRSFGPRTPGEEPLWFRLDCHFHMKEPDWRKRISIFEINACAVGGIHYAPIADEMFREAIFPFIKSHLADVPPIKSNPDPRGLLYGILKKQAALTGRKSLRIAYSEDTTAEDGVTEGPYIVEHWKLMGIDAVYADPRELYLKDDEIHFKGLPVDIVYRNFELRDIIEWEAEGERMDAARYASSKGRLVSSICGDFDHKAMWEALGSPRFEKYFTPEDAAVFRAFLPWTRTLRQEKTDGPEGLTIDTPEYAVRNKDILVLKPNRLCGGYGIAIGKDTPQVEWDSLVDGALKEEGGWVLQRYGEPEEYVFPLFENGSLAFEKHNIVYGLSATEEGTGVLARVSRQNVVNVAQQGGLMPVWMAQEAP